jgi:alkylation response protein AidB-like acyl-CoA dehydrogenase
MIVNYDDPDEVSLQVLSATAWHRTVAPTSPPVHWPWPRPTPRTSHRGIVERGMDGSRSEALQHDGLRGKDLRHLYFNDVRLPKQNVLGKPGEDFDRHARTHQWRLSLGTDSVAAADGLIDATNEHVLDRRRCGRPLADLERVKEKIGRRVSYLFGLKSLTYVTAGRLTNRCPTPRSSRPSAGASPRCR